MAINHSKPKPSFTETLVLLTPYTAWIAVGTIGAWGILSVSTLNGASLNPFREMVGMVLLCTSFVGFSRQVRIDWQTRRRPSRSQHPQP
ncbi:MAG: hypothetical protein KDB07_00755 [Planctomycetes bacterium]|nr:hypothetical protein [Planctomycetota bacterium]